MYDYALVAERVLLKRGTETGTEWKTENEMRVSKENKIYECRWYSCFRGKTIWSKTKPLIFILMKDKEHKLTCFPESPNVSRRSRNLGVCFFYAPLRIGYYVVKVYFKKLIGVWFYFAGGGGIFHSHEGSCFCRD